MPTNERIRKFSEVLKVERHNINMEIMKLRAKEDGIVKAMDIAEQLEGEWAYEERVAKQKEEEKAKAAKEKSDEELLPTKKKPVRLYDEPINISGDKE